MLKQELLNLFISKGKKGLGYIGLLSTRDRAARKKNAAQIHETLLPENIYMYVQFY